MLNIFTLANGRLFQEEIESLEELSRFQPIWVDLENPSPEEKRWIKQYYNLQIPDDAMDEDIEESARFYEEDNGELHIRSDFLIADEDEPRTVRVAFILNQHNQDLKSRGVLFSIHDEDVPVFRLLRLRARRAPGLTAAALAALFGTAAGAQALDAPMGAQSLGAPMTGTMATSGVNSAVTGKTVLMTSADGAKTWTCTVGTINAKYVPGACR